MADTLTKIDIQLQSKKKLTIFFNIYIPDLNRFSFLFSNLYGFVKISYVFFYFFYWGLCYRVCVKLGYIKLLSPES